MPTRTRSASLAALWLAVTSVSCERAREASHSPTVTSPPAAAPQRAEAAAPSPAPAVEPSTEAQADGGSAPALAAAPAAPAAPRPAPPRLLTAAALSPSRIALAWEPAEQAGDVTGYQVFRDGSAAGIVAHAGFTDDGLRPSTRHCYTVVALDAAGHRSGPTRTACAETPDQSPPTAPTALRAEARGERQVVVSWDAASDDVGVAGYEVLRAEALVARVPGTAVTDSGLAPAQTYCYTVRAHDAAGNVSPAAGPACATTPDLSPPSRPEPVVAEAQGERAVRVHWAPSADDVGVAAYELLRDGSVVATASDLAALEKGLHPTQRYCYTVRALDAAGNRSAEGGPACATPPDLTAPSVPSGVAATATSDTRVELRWTASTDELGVQGYEVLRDDKIVSATEATSASEAGLRPAREYCYVVRAHDASGNVSAPSKRACATTPDLTPPSAPSRIAVLPNSPTRMALVWGAAADDVAVTSYEIQRGGAVVARVDARLRHHVDAGLSPSSEACYAVVALDAAGNRSPPRGPACATTAAPGVPSGPVALRAEPESASSIGLFWEPSSDAGVVYVVYWDKGGRIGSTAKTVFSATARSAERRCYRVSAIDAEGRESPHSFEACASPREESARGTLSRADAK
jgi:chitodextrinase